MRAKAGSLRREKKGVPRNSEIKGPWGEAKRHAAQLQKRKVSIPVSRSPYLWKKQGVGIAVRGKKLDLEATHGIDIGREVRLGRGFCKEKKMARLHLD